MIANIASGMLACVVAVLDYFVCTGLHHNPDLLSRARFLAFNLITGITILCFILVSFVASSSFTLAAPVIAVYAFIELLLLFRLKNRGDYLVCSLLMTAQTWTALICMIVLTGGPQLSPITQLLSIPCVMAFFLCGNYWGGATALLSIISLGFMSLAQFYGFRYSQFAPPTSFAFTQEFILPMNFITMASLAIAYEFTYASVKRQREIEHQNFQRLASVDPLTGLSNRRKFDETLADKIDLYKKLTPMRRFALFYLDLDKFKPVNDQFGHGVGDEVLNAISSRLRLALRGADFIGRHGGDEFLIILDAVHDAAGAKALAKRFIQLIQEPIETSAGLMQVGASLGIALFPDHGADMNTLQKAADEAMYVAKRSRNGYQIFGQEPNL